MPNKYRVPLGRMADYKHPHPERTAYRAGLGAWDDYEFTVWPNRAAMLKIVQNQKHALGDRIYKEVKEDKV